MINNFWKKLIGNATFHKKEWKIAIIAQSMLESNHGQSLLAKNHNNFCGVMWKKEFENHWQLAKTTYTSPSDNITTDYLSCKSPEDFMLAYEILIKRSVYNGWENTNSSLDYIAHLKKCGYAADEKYVDKVSALIPKAIDVYEQLINEGGTVMKPTWFRIVNYNGSPYFVAFNGSKCLWKKAITAKTLKQYSIELHDMSQTYGDHNVAFDVAMDLSAVVDVDGGQNNDNDGDNSSVDHPPYFWALSPNKSSRNNTPVKKIVLHNTAGSFSSAVNWFMNSQSRVSAHAIIQRNPDDSIKFCGQSGKIAIPVPENEKAWHCSTSNADSLGIEIAADANNRGMTDWQEKRVIELVKFWLKKYGLTKKDIYAHRELSQTDCPTLIWPTQVDWEKWIEKNF